MHFETFAPDSQPVFESLGGTAAHPEDAFLAAVARVVRCSQAERQVLRALACEALDQADGPEGDFGQLEVEPWLQLVAPCARRHGVAAQRVRLFALAIVAYIADAGLVDPVTAASLRRDLRRTVPAITPAVPLAA